MMRLISNVDPDQLDSAETRLSGSTLFPGPLVEPSKPLETFNLVAIL